MSVPSIYIMECGWAGCIIVVAFSEEEAVDLMKGELNYENGKKLIRRNLMDVGIVHVNLGDL